VGRDSSVGIATGYGLDGPGIESRWGARFSAPVQTGPVAHPASCTTGTGSFLEVKSGRGVTLTPHPLLVLLVMKGYSDTSTPPMGRTACTEPQCLYKGDLYLYLLNQTKRNVFAQVRQNYIRRRLLTTYKALERLSQSEFNLDRLEVTAATAAATVNSTANSAGGITPAAVTSGNTHLTVPGSTPNTSTSVPPSATSAAVLRVVKQRANKNLPLTIRDVERERGKPLSKYERNMMIFNWLHTLDDSSFEGLQ